MRPVVGADRHSRHYPAASVGAIGVVVHTINSGGRILISAPAHCLPSMETRDLILGRVVSCISGGIASHNRPSGRTGRLRAIAAVCKLLCLREGSIPVVLN